MTSTRYDLYINSPMMGVIQAADVVVEEQDAVLSRVGFRYRPPYLEHPNAFAIDPVQLPLKQGETILVCQGGVPAFIDDYLPDAWGRRVLARLALYRDQQHFNANSVIDSLGMIGNSRIGAICLVEQGEAPLFEAGHSIRILQQAESAAQKIDSVDFNTVDLDEMSLLYLANAGTGVGGARPKALLQGDGCHYLAKFNRLTQDAYNNARVELACLSMAKAAGIIIGNGKVVSGINGREVLLLDRFDIVSGGARCHLITANGLLKEPGSQRDSGRVFRYDDVCEQLRRYSISIEQDLKQLLALMLFNRAIHNTDDHERNFSLINRGAGYQLAPAYDLVPSVVTGEYHAAGFQLNPDPPKPSEASKLGKIFGLPKTSVADIAERVIDAVSRWESFAEQSGVNQDDVVRIKRCLHL